MKRLLPILMGFAFLLLSSTEGWSLPPCPGSPTSDYKEKKSWTDCEGTYTDSNGNKYVGEWKDGKRNGQGTYTHSPNSVMWAGAKYIGEFKDGLKHGHGTYTFADRSKYVGGWKDDNRHGQGTDTYASGSKYVGEYKDGVRHGHGTYTDVNGTKYVGEFRYGVRHGHGTYTDADGRVKEGIWNNNKYLYAKKPSPTVTAQKILTKGVSLPLCPGSPKSSWSATSNWTDCFGTVIFSDWSSYVGQWKDGKYHGQGKYFHADGAKYVGQWKDGKYHGQGTYTSVGDKASVFRWRNYYVGEWKNGNKHGQGIHYNEEGDEEQVGIWENNKFKKPSPTVTANKSSTRRSSLPPCKGSPTSNRNRIKSWTDCFGTVFVQGGKYVGEWKNGERNGQGTHTDANGRVEEGIWERDRLIGGKNFSYNPEHLKRFKETGECSNCNLKKANLGQRILEGAILIGANLEQANLEFAKLQGANLQYANLLGARLANADLRNANLKGAYLQRASLYKANLQKADLRGANLWLVELNKAQLLHADLSNTYLHRASLQDANLKGANLEAAIFGTAILLGTDLSYANLKRARLEVAELGATILRGTNLEGAKLNSKGVSSAKVLGAINIPEPVVVAKKKTPTVTAKKKTTSYNPEHLKRLKETNKCPYCDLRGADLTGAKLLSAKLQGANLHRASLGGANLHGADLQGANLQGAHLYTTNLIRANLHGADLRGANLQDADLQGADLKGANLEGADLDWSNLNGARLDPEGIQIAKATGAINIPEQPVVVAKKKTPVVTAKKTTTYNPEHLKRLKETNICPDCNLKGANLMEASLMEAKLQGADLQGANLFRANLIGANFIGSNLRGANLIEATLIYVYLNYANLREANLFGASLLGANLQGAFLYHANLRNAHLLGAKLQGAKLQGANLKGAKLDPEGVKIAKASGAINVPAPVVAAKKTPNATPKRKPPVVAKVTPKKTTPKPPAQSISASGFFVSKLGHVITNEHVVRNCKSVTVGDNANKQSPANVEEKDKRNDLALLKLSALTMASAETKSLIAKLGIRVVPLASDGLLRSEDVELGERIMVSGYPFGDIFSNTIKVTGGMVSAVRGMGDDSSQFTMDAAVQKGSSGGPIYDENGNVVGVVVAKLDRAKVAKRIGSMPENMNFGIKASTVRQFLTSSGLPTKWSRRSKSMSTKELAKIAQKQTLMVMCHQ